jgi:hypothetical protein
VIGDSDTNAKQNTRPSKRPVQGARPIFVALAVLVAAVVFWAARERGPSSVQPSLTEVSAEFSAVAPPPGANPSAGAPEATTKVGAVLVSSRYSIADSFDSVRRYYREELPKAGWKFRRALPSHGNSIDLYCKETLQASVESISREQSTELFTLSMSWSGVSLRECT